MVLVPGGAFTMGAAHLAEPVHEVTVSSFYLDEHEVTYGLWYAVRLWAEANEYRFAHPGCEGDDGTAGAAPTERRGEPVTGISWCDAIVWCNARSQKEGLAPVYTSIPGAIRRDSTVAGCEDTVFNDGRYGYRLPTEAEWEYAARYVGSCSWMSGLSYSGGDYNDVAWTTSPPTTMPVGTKKANHLGAFDMTGNVLEWCWDWAAPYGSDPLRDPKGPDNGTYRAARFGAPCAGREMGLRPTDVGNFLGFRCARSKR
jgi:formylglycine-generating enzyme required for sulfatase activity